MLHHHRTFTGAIASERRAAARHASIRRAGAPQARGWHRPRISLTRAREVPHKLLKGAQS